MTPEDAAGWEALLRACLPSATIERVGRTIDIYHAAAPRGLAWIAGPDSPRSTAHVREIFENFKLPFDPAPLAALDEDAWDPADTRWDPEAGEWTRPGL